jgi:hypothetical protein
MEGCCVDFFTSNTFLIMKRPGKVYLYGAMLEAALLISMAAVAQTADGNQGISQANTMVRSYFSTATQLMYAVGALVGLIGAVRVYLLWSHGDPHTGKVATAWFSACIFLVVVAAVIQSFFGL